MSLRPTSLYVNSSTEIEIVFNKKLSENITVDNFIITPESFDDYIRINSVAVIDNSIFLTTSPQNYQNLYTLQFVDGTSKFLAIDGDRLPSDSTSNIIYIIGGASYNPVRDRVFSGLNKIYDLAEDSVVRNLLTVNSDELYSAQKSLGELLSNNYISANVIDEERVRGSGPKDRLANEGAYSISRVSRFKSTENLLFKEIIFSTNNYQSSIGQDIISLQQRIKTESFVYSAQDSIYQNLILTVSAKNIIKLLDFKIYNNDSCKVEYIYNIKRYGYGLLESKYDKRSAKTAIKNNQILISEHADFYTPADGDILEVTYIYKDKTESPNISSVSLSSIEYIESEAVPKNIAHFNLKNFPIVSESGELIDINGVTFETNGDSPFIKELKFNTSKLPSNYGEYSIDYNTGTVFCYGTELSSGTGNSFVKASYFYKNDFKNNIDYTISEYDLVANSSRAMANKELTISLSYNSEYVNGEDYIAEIHNEVFSEKIYGNIDSYSAQVLKAPITKVHQIKNLTTGEVYKPTFFSGNRIYFNTFIPPEIGRTTDSIPTFSYSAEEDLASGLFGYSKLLKVKIVSAASRASIEFYPKIPAALLDLTSAEYKIHNDNSVKGIRLFGEPDSDNMIGRLAIFTTEELPNVGDYYWIGIKFVELSLTNSYILNSNKTSVGSKFDTSITFSNPIFKTEKLFYSDLEFISASNDYIYSHTLTSANRSFANLSKVGNYIINYITGKIYLTIGDSYSSFGTASYYYSKLDETYKNIISLNDVYLKTGDIKEELPFDKKTKKLFLNNHIMLHTGDSTKLADGREIVSSTVLDDYTVYLKNPVSFVKGVFTSDNLFGKIGTDFKEELSGQNFESRNIYSGSVSDNLIDLKTKYITRIRKIEDVFYIRFLDNDYSEVIKIVNETSGIVLDDIDVTITFVDGYVTIQIADTELIEEYDTVGIYYIKSNIPSAGTKVITICSIKQPLIDITECFDDIYITYEWGDNELNWQISDSLSNGDIYYVSYKYGASREALRTNFGILTKIPYFTNFSLNTSREEYRSALSGLLAAFTRGPVKESFEGLIGSISGQIPAIDDSNSSNWILGEDLLNQNLITVNGNIDYQAIIDNDGIMFNDDILIKAPALSNINPDKGTISFWTKSSWKYIDNDADLIFDLTNLGPLQIEVLPGQNIFSKYGFTLFDAGDDFGYIDYSGHSIDIYNDENSNIITTGIVLSNDRSVQWISSKISFNLQTELLGENSLLNDYFIADSTLLSERISLFSSTSLMHAPSFITRGLDGGSIEVINSYYSSPFFISIGDGSRVVNMTGTLIPVKNHMTGRILAFEINSSMIDANPIPRFDGEYEVRNCNCISYSELDNLLAFRDNSFNEITITLSYAEDLTYLSEEFHALEIPGFRYVTADGAIYKIIRFENSDGPINPLTEEFTKIIVDRYPVNNLGASADGSAAINALNPISSGIICFSTISFLLSSNDSEILHSFDPRAKLINYLDQKIPVIIDRVPSQNIVRVNINNNLLTIAYSDFISVYSTTMILDSIGQELDRYSDVSFEPILSGISDINSGMFFGILDLITSSRLSLDNLNIVYSESLPLENIFIGSKSENPKSYKFTVNKNIKNIVGKSNVIDQKSLYIWLDDSCTTDESSGGLWRVSATIPNTANVISDGYSDLYHFVEAPDSLKFKITTDGLFANYKTNQDCNIESFSDHWRFSGLEKLEDSGWKKLTASDSDLINVTLGGISTSYSWDVSKDLTTSLISQIYSISSDKKCTAHFPLNNNSGTLSYSISFRVTEIDLSDENNFSGTVSGSILPFNPAEIILFNKHIKISIGILSDSRKVLIFLDGVTSQIIDIVNYDWDIFEEILINISDDTGIFIASIGSRVLTRFKLSTCNDITSCTATESGVYMRLSDSTLFDSEYSVSAEFDYIDLIFSNIVTTFEELDNIIITSNSLDVMLKNNSDGYADSDGYYADGLDSDEISFTSDREKYLFDVGELTRNRISILKDQYGFLVARILDSTGALNEVSYSLKSNSNNELMHIALSWIANSQDSEDLLRLFVNGSEVPALWKFGNKLTRSALFGDIAKEEIQDYVSTKITYSSEITATMIAGSSMISLDEFSLTEDDIGRTIIITSVNIADIYLNKAYVIIGLEAPGIMLGDFNTAEEVIFDTTDDIGVTFAPIVPAGLLDSDFINDKISVMKSDCSDNREELGVIKYSVDNEYNISILENRNITAGCRINITTGSIEFIKKLEDCTYVPSASMTDQKIYLNTFGLTKEKTYEIIDLSSDSKFYNSDSNYINLNLPAPISLSNVKITKIIKDRFIPSIEIDGDLYRFSEECNSKCSTANCSAPGRLINIHLDSDNINWNATNKIILYGLNNVSGPTSEEILITGPGVYTSTIKYTELNLIDGELYIVDPTEECCVISAIEKSIITSPDEGFDNFILDRYSNGILYLHDSNGDNSSLTGGKYIFDYSTFLKLKLDTFNNEIYIGKDISGKNPANTQICRLKITTDVKDDVRSYEYSADNSITEEFLNKNKELDASTLLYIPFDNKLRLQLRILRNKIFLNTAENTKFKLNTAQLDSLIPVINSREEFVFKLNNIIFDEALSLQTFVEINNNLIQNIVKENVASEFLVSENSVNATFGHSAIFNSIPGFELTDISLINSKMGTIEFWVNPIYDIYNLSNKMTLFHYASTAEVTADLLSNKYISLSMPAEKIYGIYIAEDAYFKNYASEAILVNNGTRIVLNTKIKTSKKVKVIYLAKGVKLTEIKIYMQNSAIYADVKIDTFNITLFKYVTWSLNSWHKIGLSWSVTDGKLKMLIDGETSSTSMATGEFSSLSRSGRVIIGNSHEQNSSALSKIDNVRISKIDRFSKKDSLSSYIDFDYAINLAAARPMISDGFETIICNFEHNTNPHYAMVKDSSAGIYEFNIDIYDQFDKITSDELEDLLLMLINKIKPSHTNVSVKFV